MLIAIHNGAKIKIIGKKIIFVALSQIYGSKPDAVKSAYSGLTSLYVEAARQHFDKEKLSTTLKDSQLNAQQINKICEAYDINREQFQRKLQVIGGGLPHLVDVNWKLDYCIKVRTYCFSPCLPLFDFTSDFTSISLLVSIIHFYF